MSDNTLLAVVMICLCVSCTAPDIAENFADADCKSTSEELRKMELMLKAKEQTND